MVGVFWYRLLSHLKDCVLIRSVGGYTVSVKNQAEDMWTSWAVWLGLRQRNRPHSLEAAADQKDQACLCAGQAHRIIVPNSTSHFWIHTVYYFHRQQKQEQKRCQLPVGLFPQDDTKSKGARWQCSTRTSVPGCWGANWCCSLGPQPAAVGQVGQAGLKRWYPEARESLMTASLERRQVAGKQPSTHSSTSYPMCQDPGGSQSILPKLRSAVVKPCPMRGHEERGQGARAQHSRTRCFSNTSGGRMSLADS